MTSKYLSHPRLFFWTLLLALFAAGAYGSYVYSRGSIPFLFCRVSFNYFLASESKEIDKQARSGLSNTYYFTSYYLNGMLSAAEGTGSEQTLNRTLKLIDTMISTAQEFESNGRTYRAWRPFAISADTSVPRPNLHFIFQATVPIARAAAIIMTHPEWKNKYGDTARRYIAFVDQSIIQYWYHDQLKDQIPWIDPDHFPIWNDNGSNLCLCVTFLYQATGNQLYMDLCRQIGQSFQKKLAPYNEGWIWENQTIPIGSDTDNTPESVGNQAGVPDTSHTNREAFLMMSLYESGVLFTRDDLSRMAKTLTHTIWNRSMDDPSFANYLNGSNKPYRVYKKPGLNGSIYHGWALMGGYSKEAQEVMIAALKAIVKGKNNPSLERNKTSYGGKLGLSGHILRNFKILEKNKITP